jgi:hypothetical protein
MKEKAFQPAQHACVLPENMQNDPRALRALV